MWPTLSRYVLVLTFCYRYVCESKNKILCANILFQASTATAEKISDLKSLFEEKFQGLASSSSVSSLSSSQDDDTVTEHPSKKAKKSVDERVALGILDLTS